jgi:hypothetical protein
VTPEVLALAELIAIPVEASGPVRAYIGLDGGGWRVYLAIDGGRGRQYVGPAFGAGKRGQRQAGELCRALNERGADR